MTAAAFVEHFASEPLVRSKVNRVAFTEQGCWEYPTGPTFRYAKRTKNGKNEFVHRVSLQIKLGRALGPGEVTRHQCDNPPCVNPAHLEPGTKRDNARDMVERGRARNKAFRGEDNWKAHPLTVVQAARADYAAGMSQDAVAAKYGVARCAVRDWVHGKRSDAGPSIARTYERPPCGTAAGFRSHAYYGEQPCEECRVARNAYQREMHRRRRARANP